MDDNREQIWKMQQYDVPRMPFYMSYPMQNLYLTEMEYEKDMERMKELYPKEVTCILEAVEEECDKMEYEGSLMFDEYPDREEEYGNDEKRQYDRYAGFIMDEKLNQAAAHRLEAALANGYSGDAIPGEGTLKDYLGKISYRKNSSCRELYLRGREDVDDAFDKLIGKTQDKYDSNGKRKDSLDYYRRVGMAHAEKDGEQYFMVILMR